MTLNHSKTWPVTTMAVVQLRVNPQEIIENGQREDEAQPKQFEKLFNENEARNNELVVPLLEKHLEIFAKMSSAPNLKATIRTDTVSTILDPADFDSERNEICEEPPLKSPTLLRGDSVQKFHVLALTRIEETSVGVDVDDESGGGVDGKPRHSGLHMYGRRPSIKVDNWDFIYTERGPEVQIPCPIHRYPLNSPNGRLDSNGLKDSLLPPDLPIDARKAATLRRHYYPEGGWGWVVATCAILVHLLNHGVQLAYSQLVLPGAEKFRVEKVHFADEGPKTTMSSLSRAQSWPLLSGAVPVEDARNIATKTQIQARRFVCRHYYPEGGWGWVVTACAVLVHVINHGIQLSCSQLVAPASFKFHVNPVYPAGRGGLFIGMQNTTDEEFSSDGRPRRSGLSRSRSLPQLSHHDSGLGSFYGGSGADDVPVSRAARLVADLRQLLTLKQHYYPEGGWGWVVLVCAMFVQILGQGMLTSVGLFYLEILKKFGMHEKGSAGWLGAMSTGVALLISPVTIAFCRRKSTRVTAVMGGLITALGCLFTSFATQFHQLFFSYGTVVGIGVGITRDCSTLMVAQYFKRRREFVEIFIVSGSGLGIASMSLIVRSTIGALGWRLGLQVVTGAISVTFILGTFYRSASLYHPQRRAILHIKNQKRKIKDKNKVEDKVPFFDFSTLKSKTVRILLISTGISAFGINTPLFYLAYQAEVEGLGDSTIFLQVYLGLAWTVGCVVFSTLVLHNSTECRIARQYLCQTAVFMCGLSILAFTVVSGNYHAYVMFAWIYGIFCGGYHYSLKMYTYERVRARNFARTWGFVQCSQAIPIVIGVPFSGYMNEKCGDRAGYYFSSTCVLVGSLTLFLIDLHRRKIARHKHTRENGTRHLCVSETCPQRRKLSFSQEPDNNDGGVTMGAAAAALVLGTDIGVNQSGGLLDNIVMSNEKPELTCISEEGIADMDLPDNLLDDLDYIGDCITSCNKVENYLMLSEFENNLIAEMPVILDRKGRRWSLARSKPTQTNDDTNNDEENGVNKGKWKVFPNRVITVIDESSV